MAASKTTILEKTRFRRPLPGLKVGVFEKIKTKHTKQNAQHDLLDQLGALRAVRA